MKNIRRDGRRLGWILALAAGLAPGGCAEELGPEKMKTTTVHGTITQGERPIRGGWIEFIPAEGTVGNQRSAVIREDGSYSADRVPVGEVAIRLLDITIVPPFPTDPKFARRAFGAFPPAIRKVIPEQPSELNLELLEELVANQARKNAVEQKSSGGSGATP